MEAGAQALLNSTARLLPLQPRAPEAIPIRRWLLQLSRLRAGDVVQVMQCSCNEAVAVYLLLRRHMDHVR